MTVALGQRTRRSAVGTRRRFERFALPGTATTKYWVLASTLAVLNMVGVLMVISASSVESSQMTHGASPWALASKQMKFTVMGIVVMFVVLRVPMRAWRRIAYPLFVLSLVPLALVLLPSVGRSSRGATRWIDLGPVQFQPSEFVKFTILLAVADILTRHASRVDDWRESLRPALIPLVVAGGLVMAQPNLGTMLVITAIVLAIVWFAGVALRPLGVVAAVVGALAGIAVLLEPFRLKRLLSFLDPKGDLDGQGYQTGQAMIGFANGGWLGRAVGRSTVKWGYLPFAYNDFIFAVVGEELGFAGAVFVILTFLVLIVFGILVALDAQERFSMLVGVGVTAWLGAQAVFNIAVTTGSMPLTGVPLPFISIGGSAQIANFAAAGLLLNVARHPSRRVLDAGRPKLRIARAEGGS